MKKIVCGILAGCLVLATATGCQKNASGKTPITLNEVAHSIFYAPQYAAIELGYFDEEGLDVTLVNGGGADKVMTALVSGEADIGFMGSEASVYTYANGEARLRRKLCPADPEGRKLPGGSGTGAGFPMGKLKREKGPGRKGRRHAPDGL